MAYRITGPGLTRRTQEAFTGFMLTLVLFFSSTTFSHGGQAELLEMSLQELMDLPVMSITQAEQGLFSTPAALYVITSEDIRRSGHQFIPELLRMAPGATVGRVSARHWAMSTRGFNSVYANKQQVLIDGRVIYNQLFSGVYWDTQSLMLEDVDRIEVIRGPGATLWGANAVNGVININTKSAERTQGLYVSGGVGSSMEGLGEARYGGRLGETTYYRLWGKYLEHDNFETPDGIERGDHWDMATGGFRIDSDLSDDMTFTMIGDYHYSDSLGESLTMAVPGPVPFQQERADLSGEDKGGNILFRVNQEKRSHGWQLQSYYTQERRYFVIAPRDQMTMADIDLRGHVRLNDTHNLEMGTGYRYRKDETTASSLIHFTPEDVSTDLLSAFIQDTITLSPDRVFAMIGSKFEENDFTGTEIQPSARVWWTPDATRTYWAAVSRPVRTPSLLDRSLNQIIAYGPDGPLTILGNPDIESEEVMSYELGYRMIPTPGLLIDTAFFFNDYDNLVLIESDTLTFGNDVAGESWGGELVAKWDINEQCSIQGSYSYLDVSLSGAETRSAVEGSTPEHIVHARCYYDLSEDVSLNAATYFADRTDREADSYVRADIGLSWKVSEHASLDAWVQNLTDSGHVEFQNVQDRQGLSEIPRSGYVQLRVNY